MDIKTDIRIDREFTGYHILIDVDEQGESCALSFKPTEKEYAVTPDIVHKMLTEAGVVNGVDDAAIQRFCKNANENGAIKNVLVAKGTPPVEGEDAHLEFLVQVSTRRPVLESASDTTAEKTEVDFHAAKRFENVAAGQKIAVVHKARQPVPGATVKGEPVQPPSVRDNLVVKAGKNVLMEGDDLFAQIDGRVVNEGGTISVTDDFVVSKNVDYDVGHIDFVGAVRVYGDVLDGFNVRGKKSVRIDKNVGNSTIESDGDIELAGMTGRDEGGMIRCGGTITARFLDNVTVECAGDVIVKNEIMHSNIKCSGKIIVQGGAIVGGECMALEGIEAVVLGSDSTAKTQLRAGVDFKHLLRILPLQDALTKIRKQSQELITRVGPYARNPDPASLPEGIKKRLTEMLEQIQDLSEKRKKIEERIAALEKEFEDRKNPKINATKKLYAGTIIHLGNTVEEARSNVSQAVSIIEHLHTELKFLKYTPLHIKAQVLEQKLRAAEEAAEREKTVGD
ncbi:MAG: DUF342 domain-containing protein [Spartobacteria bacterium]|nr:DUF342 domain-containing protein [Spartobacteria bacterium]